MSSSDPDMEKADNRVNLLQFSYQLEALLEAVYLLHEKTIRSQNANLGAISGP
jgi:hypothetical protein